MWILSNLRRRSSERKDIHSTGSSDGAEEAAQEDEEASGPLTFGSATKGDRKSSLINKSSKQHTTFHNIWKKEIVTTIGFKDDYQSD